MAKKTVHLHGAKAFKNTDANQNIIGDGKNNTVNGLGGKDIYDGGKGGGDKLIIHADWADAKITETKDGFKIKVGHDVMTVKNVEKFVFDDGTFTNKTLINHAPTGTPKPLAAGTEDTDYTVTAAQLLKGIKDSDKDALSVSGLKADNGATITDNHDGTYTIHPAADFNGTLNLSYKVTDARGASIKVTNTLDIANVNDAPTGTATPIATHGTEDTPFTVSTADLTAGITDKDGDTLSVSGLTVDHGTVKDNGDGTFTITPDANYNGTVNLTYTVDDGHGGTLAATNTVTIDSVNDAPTGTSTATLAAGTEDQAYTVTAADLLQGFSDVDGDTLTVTGLTSDHGTVKDNGDGTFTITPDKDFNGDMTLTFTVDDGHGGTVAGSNKVNFVDVAEGFNLTKNTDTPALTAGSDVITGVVSALSSENTLNPLDVIVDVGGTDTLKVDLKADFGGFTGTGKMTGVETIDLTNSSTVARTFNATGITGATQYNLTGAVNLAGLTEIAAVDAGARTAALTLGYASAATVGTADVLNLSITDFGTADDASTAIDETAVVAITVAGIETTNLTVSGTNVIDLSGVDSKALTAAGDGSVQVTALNVAAKTVDFSAVAGDVSLTLTNLNLATSIKTGAGDDTIVLNAADDVAANATIAGGDGNDTLIVTSGAAKTVEFTQTGIETLAFGAQTASLTMSLQKTSGVTTVTALGNEAASSIGAFSGSVSVLNAGSSALTFNLQGANSSGGSISSDGTGAATVAVNTPAATATVDAADDNGVDLTLDSVTSLNLSVASKMSYSGTISAAAATSVELAFAGASNGATIEAAKATSVVISAVDATSTLTIDAAAATDLQITNAKDLVLTGSSIDALESLTSSGAGALNMTGIALDKLHVAEISNTGIVTLDTIGTADLGYGVSVDSTGAKAFTAGDIVTNGNAISVDISNADGAVNLSAITAHGSTVGAYGNVDLHVSAGGALSVGNITGNNVSFNVAGMSDGGAITTAIEAHGNVTYVGTNLASNTSVIALEGTSQTVALTGGLGTDTFTLNGGQTNTSITVSGNLGSDTADHVAVNADTTAVTPLAVAINISGLSNYDTAALTGNDAANAITGGAGVDTITGGAGKDVMAGGAGADVFVFDHGDSGQPLNGSTVSFDTISDFAKNSDVIEFGVALSIVTNGSTSTHVAAIDSEGIATFDAGDSTLAQRITAVEAGIVAGTNADGATAIFQFGSDSYVFISDGVDGIGADDVLVKLTGVTGLTESSITGTDLLIM